VMDGPKDPPPQAASESEIAAAAAARETTKKARICTSARITLSTGAFTEASRRSWRSH